MGGGGLSRAVAMTIDCRHCYPDAAKELELLGHLSVKSIPTSRDCNIRRIGSLQSRIRFPVAEVICVTASDGLFRLGEGAGREVRDRDSSIHHRSGIQWMTAPTMLSPSSLPRSSSKVSETGKNI